MRVTRKIDDDRLLIPTILRQLKVFEKRFRLDVKWKAPLGSAESRCVDPSPPVLVVDAVEMVEHLMIEDGFDHVDGDTGVVQA